MINTHFVMTKKSRLKSDLDFTPSLQPLPVSNIRDRYYLFRCVRIDFYENSGEYLIGSFGKIPNEVCLL
jgi:hypothetical protein